MVECGQVSVELYKITSEPAQRPMYPVLKSIDLDVFVSQNIYLPGRLTCNEKKLVEIETKAPVKTAKVYSFSARECALFTFACL